MMQPALELGYEVIGHIPKNRALYALPVEAYPPSPIKRKGRKRKYGAKMTPEEVEKLPETTMTIWLYRKYRTVSFGCGSLATTLYPKNTNHFLDQGQRKKGCFVVI